MSTMVDEKGSPQPLATPHVLATGTAKGAPKSIAANPLLEFAPETEGNPRVGFTKLCANVVSVFTKSIGRNPIIGRVYGDIHQGVTITLAGPATAQTTTDADGNFCFNGLADGCYMITPQMRGYQFAPSSDAVTVSGSKPMGRVFLARQSGNESDGYCAVDVSAGPDAASYPITYIEGAPTLNDQCRMGRIVLRRLPAGGFVMGSPANEIGRERDEQQHTVMLTSAFYMGVFPITQAQYLNVMGGSNPSLFPGELRPVEEVPWNTIRGGTWPGGTPAEGTFMDKVRAKTGLSFDLPTEAQWEYACRAGTTRALNNDTNLTHAERDQNMDLLGRYWGNGGSTGEHAPVGMYRPNNWGLYDMHGNVWEWCLDWYGLNYESSDWNRSDLDYDMIDPPGPPWGGSERLFRGGCWRHGVAYCRSASRLTITPGQTSYSYGFRLALPADQ